MINNGFEAIGNMSLIVSQSCKEKQWGSPLRGSLPWVFLFRPLCAHVETM